MLRKKLVDIFITKKNNMELNRDEYNWINQSVIGRALLIKGGSIDSFGNQIKGDIYYEIGKRKSDGMVAILPTEKNQKHDFINSVMKRNNKFN